MKQQHDSATDNYALEMQLPAAAPDPADSVIVLATAGRPEAVTTLLQQPDSTVTLPAYLADVHPATGDAGLRFDSRGVAERWTDPGAWLDWEFRVSSPGEFNVALLTSEQKNGRGWEGGHRVRVDVAGKEVTGVVENNGRVENPSNPYWTYVKSNIGKVRIDTPGLYSLSLKPETIESAKKLGLTLVSVKLAKAD